MTCLRHPIERIKSSIKYHKKQTVEQVISWAMQNEFQDFAPISGGSQSVNNFYVRSFAGREVYMKVMLSLALTASRALLANTIVPSSETWRVDTSRFGGC